MKTIIKTIIGMTLVGGWITTGIMNAPPDTPEEARAKLIGRYEFAELNLRLSNNDEIYACYDVANGNAYVNRAKTFTEECREARFMVELNTKDMHKERDAIVPAMTEAESNTADSQARKEDAEISARRHPY